jgi:ABC-type bacteriocin/lantibiotic exporter with double-glycine peptidase domain
MEFSGTLFGWEQSFLTYVLLFMKYRRSLDYKRFAQASEEQSNLIQLISGMPDIKLATVNAKALAVGADTGAFVQN